MRGAAVLIVLAVSAGAAVWLLRDLPRQRVEAALASRLGAEVSVGALSIDSLKQFVLRDVRLERMAAQPRLESLQIETLRVTGSIRHILGGRIEALGASGVTLRLSPPLEEEPAAAEEEAAEVSIGALEIERGELILAAARVSTGAASPPAGGGAGVRPSAPSRINATHPRGGSIAALPATGGAGGEPSQQSLALASAKAHIDAAPSSGGSIATQSRGVSIAASLATGGSPGEPSQASIAFSAALTGVGGDLSGAVEFRSERFEIRTVIASLTGTGREATPAAPSAGGTVERLEGSVRVGESGRRADARIQAAACAIDDGAGRTVRLSDPMVNLDYRRDDAQGVWRLAVRPAVSLARSASLDLAFDSVSGGLARLSARVEGLDLAAALAAAGALPAGWRVEGTLDLAADGDPSDLAYEIRTDIERAGIAHRGGELEAAGVSASAAGRLRLAEGARGASVRGRIGAAALRGKAGGWNIPARLTPLSITLEGEVERASVLEWRGTAAIDTAGAGSLSARGRIEVPLHAAAFEEAARTASMTKGGRIVETAAETPGETAGETAGEATRETTGETTGNTGAEAALAWKEVQAHLDWRWRRMDLSRLAALAKEAGVAIPAEMAIGGAAAAAGTLRGPPGAPAFEATLDLADLELAWQRVAGPGQEERTVAPALEAAAHVLFTLSEGEAKVRIRWRRPSAPLEIVGLTLRGSTAVPPLGPKAVAVKAAGSFDPGSRILRLASARIESPGLVRAELAAEGSISPPIGAATLHFEGIDLSRWRPFLRPLTGDPAPGFALAGEAAADFTLTMDEGGRWKGAGAARIERSGFSSDDGANVLEGLDTRWVLRLEGNLPQQRISAQAEAEVGGFQLLWGTFFADGSALLSSVALGAEAAYGDSSPAPADAAEPAAGEAKCGESSPAAARSMGPVAGEAASGSASCAGFVLQDQGAETGGEENGTDARTRPSTAVEHGSATRRAAAEPRHSNRVAHDESVHTDGDSREGGDGGDRTGTRDARPLAVAVAGENDTAPPEARWSWKGDLVWTFPEGPELRGSLQGAPGAPLRYSLTVVADDLRTTVQKYLREPMGDAIPYFTKIEAGGSLIAEARGLLAESERTFEGRLRLDGLRLAGTEGAAEVQGLDLDLPLDVRWGPAGEDGRRPISGEERFGRLAFSNLVVQGLELPLAETGLRGRSDSVALEEGLAVNLLGGVLGLERLTLVDILRPTRRLESALVLANVSLERVAQAFGLPQLEGTLDASFPIVRLRPDRLLVEGGGDLSIFGGRVVWGEISGEDVLSRYPKITFSAEFEDIDLGRVTRTFDFGEMTGIVRGHVRDCELFRGVPVAFDALIETVDRKKTRKTVNVKAINNIAILGTGGKVGVLDRGIHKFFDKYNYSRIGVRMTLRNDELLMRGLARRGRKELFVKGGFPFPIDVVNAQPGAPVSFQAMVERLQSLDLGAVTVGR